MHDRMPFIIGGIINNNANKNKKYIIVTRTSKQDEGKIVLLLQYLQ